MKLLQSIFPPKLVLQPFLENSIRYALENSENTCEINLSVSQEENTCKICISDNGPGIEDEIVPQILSGKIHAKGNGVGIKNVNDRLKLLYAIPEPLTITAADSGGTCITIFIPLNK